MTRPTTYRILAILAVILAAAAPPLAAAQTGAPTGPTGPMSNPSSFTPDSTFATRFGIEGLGANLVLNQGQGWALAASGQNLTNIDPLSGALINDVANPISPATAITHDLAEQGLLLIDLQNLQEQARRQAEEAREQREEDGITTERRENPGTPEEWELKHFSTCGHETNAGYRARIEVVDAFEQLCRDAENAGINLRINSAYRDPAHQKQLYDRAVERYGSHAAARRWVAYSDGETCTSMHCAGIAIDVALTHDPATEPWLHQTVGCLNPGGHATLGTDTCTAEQETIQRVQLYGLIFPLTHEPWHMEWGLSTTATTTPDCNPPASLSIPAQIGAIFRCRLAQTGITGPEADRIVAEAVTVARCESSWNPEAIVFSGRYINEPHPRTGYRYTARGVFQFIRDTADTYIDGGWDQADDPVRNIDAAARLYLDQRNAGNRGWEPWACANPTDGFQTSSVLPNWPGGPDQLPTWAHDY